MNFETMTIEQLEAANRELDAEKQAIREKQRELNAALSKKIEEAELAREQERLSQKFGRPVQVLQPAGIETAEAVGTLGAKG
jgi:peptidoglycan hydrolase CwlO-like protein